MTMINCSTKDYLKHMSATCGWHTKDMPEALKLERRKLASPEAGLVPHGIIKNTEYGRQVHLETWLMALRAHTRGKLALPRLLGAPQFGQEERNGRQVRVRLKPSPEAKAEALAKQGDLLQRLAEACPLFFTGMLVPEEVKDAA